jgi:hypothetical protein
MDKIFRIPACLYYVMIKIVSFSMSGHKLRSLWSGLRYGQNYLFQHGWNVSWSKPLVLACLDHVMVKIVSFSMDGMCHGANCKFSHVWIMSSKPKKS